MTEDVLPHSPNFPTALESCCNQLRGVIATGGHHDQRRNPLLNFLREGMGIESTEVELERKIKAAEVRGRIDAFWRRLIIEVKSDLERERDDAREDLKEYFEAVAGIVLRPTDAYAMPGRVAQSRTKQDQRT